MHLDSRWPRCRARGNDGRDTPAAIFRTRRPSPASGRRCDGYAGASSATLGRYHPARKAPVVRLPGNPVGLPGTLLGSLGSPCGTRVTAFSAPAAASNGRSMGVTVGG